MHGETVKKKKQYIFYFILILYFLTQRDALNQDIDIRCTVFPKSQFF